MAPPPLVRGSTRCGCDMYTGIRSSQLRMPTSGVAQTLCTCVVMHTLPTTSSKSVQCIGDALLDAKSKHCTTWYQCQDAKRQGFSACLSASDNTLFQGMTLVVRAPSLGPVPDEPAHSLKCYGWGCKGPQLVDGSTKGARQEWQAMLHALHTRMSVCIGSRSHNR